MSKITAIGTAVPSHAHPQDALFEFANTVYCSDAFETRKLKFLYGRSGIHTRHSAVPDFVLPPEERTFFSKTAGLEPMPTLEQRMACFSEVSVPLSVKAINNCIKGRIDTADITHLITVSCTGMSAPGLDLQIMEAMDLSPNLQRTSVNFMGCYAAIHGMKLAHAFCNTFPGANIVVVCTELCTLHFQKEPTVDNMTASLLFADGAAAMLVQDTVDKGFNLEHFFSQVSFKGKTEMAWELSGKGFLMTLTGYVPELLKEDFSHFVDAALHDAGRQREDITHWCIHPGGKKILQTIESSMNFAEDTLRYGHEILRDYGNMSSATILFVLKKIMEEIEDADQDNAIVLGAAFGPGLTMETFVATYD